MSRIVLVLLVVLAVFSAGSSGQQCELNKEWKTCGTACPPTCEMPNPEICIHQCVTGCQCKTGYLLKSDGSCVRSEDCPHH